MSTSGFIAEKPIKPEVAQKSRQTPHSTRNHRLSNDRISNPTEKMSTSGFIPEKPIKPEVAQKSRQTPHWTRNFILNATQSRD